MNQEIEIQPIAITTQNYNLQIANLVEHLLLIDQKLFHADKSGDSKGAA